MKLSDYPQPSVTVDLVVFTIKDSKLKVLLIKRALDPFKGKWAIPGGFVQVNETIEDAAKRELEEETGIKEVYLEQLYTWGGLERDPRGRVISISYFALINSDGIKLEATTDAVEAGWFDVNKIPSLAFDHKNILDYAVKRLKWKFEYTPIAFSLLDEQFTMPQLKNLYDIVFETEFDKRNFYKKVLSLKILEEKGIAESSGHRPPKLYSLKKKIPQVLELI